MRRYALRDDQWDRIKDFLPGREGHVGGTAGDVFAGSRLVTRKATAVRLPTSGDVGSFVDVDAHKGRWTRAPRRANCSQRSPENRTRKS